MYDKSLYVYNFFIMYTDKNYFQIRNQHYQIMHLKNIWRYQIFVVAFWTQF